MHPALLTLNPPLSTTPLDTARVLSNQARQRVADCEQNLNDALDMLREPGRTPAEHAALRNEVAHDIRRCRTAGAEYTARFLAVVALSIEARDVDAEIAALTGRAA